MVFRSPETNIADGLTVIPRGLWTGKNQGAGGFVVQAVFVLNPLLGASTRET